MTPFAANVTDKRFALLFSTMIDARLIWHKHYYGWADELIAAMAEPPQWLLEIATIKYYPDAVAAINRFVYSEPFEALGDIDNEYIACIFHRYRIGEISWATFLDCAGGGRVDCEFFFHMLSDLEDANYDRELESQQVDRVQSEFGSEIESVGQTFSVFQDYFQRYVHANSEA